jgi:SAM-dependent methyltransferase
VVDGYLFDDGVYRPARGVQHREEEYSSRGLDLLLKMQRDHFWYRGRRRFLLWAVQQRLRALGAPTSTCRAVDLGGGCGGWIQHLLHHIPQRFAELALADSSRRALDLAGAILPSEIARYQIDLLDLGWNERWDVAFLLDVLEHIPDDRAALRQIYRSLRPGGLLFITTPALQCFWSWNDEIAGHQRRYSKSDYRALAATTGFDLCQTRYFMFFLSPLYAAVRLLTGRRCRGLSEDQTWELMERTHQTPAAPINALLSLAASWETPLGHVLPFPWGTSILAVLRKPGPQTPPSSRIFDKSVRTILGPALGRNWSASRK